MERGHAKDAICQFSKNNFFLIFQKKKHVISFSKSLIKDRRFRAGVIRADKVLCIRFRGNNQDYTGNTDRIDKWVNFGTASTWPGRNLQDTLGHWIIMSYFSIIPFSMANKLEKFQISHVSKKKIRDNIRCLNTTLDVLTRDVGLRMKVWRNVEKWTPLLY